MMRRTAPVLAIIQALLALRVVLRLVRTARGTRIEPAASSDGMEGQVSVLVPVLNEAGRLGPCLEGLLAQGPEVAEVIVADGGSSDGTQDLVRAFASRDARIRLVDAAPVPEGVNGKAHGLRVAQAAASTACPWMLTIDADVRTAPGLLPALLAHATRMSLPAFSVATRQRLSGAAEGVLHPAMLATLVYRFGIPGSATTQVDRVQANGQCFLVRRTELERAGGFATVLGSVCEDVTLARALAASGVPVGFHEAGDLVSVEMYGSAREAWTNWSRSLPMRDRFSGAQGLLGLAEVLLVQGLPPWLLTGLGPVLGRGHPLVTLNIALLGVRLGTLAGMARAYDHRPPTYWLSPLADLPVALRLIQMYFRRRHTWRGRPFVAGDLP